MVELRRSFGVTIILSAIVALTGCDRLPFEWHHNTMEENDVQAFESMQLLRSSLELFREAKGVYPMRWNELYPPGNGVAFGPQEFETHIDALTRHRVGGYLYTYTPIKWHWFTLTAVPKRLNNTGSRSFFLDETGAIRHCLPHTANEVAGKLDRLADQPPLSCLGI